MPSTIQTFDAFLKVTYTKDKVEDLTMCASPFVANCEKDTELQGTGEVVPIKYGNPQGHAGTRATASANETSVIGKKFLIVAGEFNSEVVIGDRVMKASRGNPGAFLKNRESEIDGLYEQAGQSLAAYFWGNGGLSLGRIGSMTGNNWTLLNPADIVNFHEGMDIVVSADDGSNVAHALRAGVCRITNVNRNTGVITVDNAANITGEANNDYIFREGTFRGNTSVFVTEGVQSFITATDTPADLYGMTQRTADPARLAGVRLPDSDVAGTSMEDRLKILGARIASRTGGKITDVALNPDDWQILEIELSSRGQRQFETDARFGFMAIKAAIGGQMVRVWSDPFCPRGTAFAFRMGTWKIHSMLDLIHVKNGDGLQMLRKNGTNDYVHELISYPGLSCNAPGWNGRVSLTV